MSLKNDHVSTMIAHVIQRHTSGVYACLFCMQKGWLRTSRTFDIETAGEIAGIVQISAEIVRFKINSENKKVGSDHEGSALATFRVAMSSNPRTTSQIA